MPEMYLNDAQVCCGNRRFLRCAGKALANAGAGALQFSKGALRPAQGVGGLA